MKKLLIALIIVLFLISGCIPQEEISKGEAENIAQNFIKSVTNYQDILVMNSYRERGYWMVWVRWGGGYYYDTGLFEINAKTRKIEHIISEGKRYSFDEVIKELK